ncbi:hypothetical protein Ancab_006533 [Ancistrocladus abbreviatus]
MGLGCGDSCWPCIRKWGQVQDVSAIWMISQLGFSIAVYRLFCWIMLELFDFLSS